MQKSVVSESVYRNAIFIMDDYLDLDVPQFGPSLGNFLTADSLLTVQNCHTASLFYGVCQSADSFQFRFFIHGCSAGDGITGICPCVSSYTPLEGPLSVCGRF